MIHILLLILKITGIIVGVILGLLIVCICTVLFVPLRYRIYARLDDTFQGHAAVYWLFHLVSIKADYTSSDPPGGCVTVKIFGRCIFDSRGNEKKSSDNTKKRKRKKKNKIKKDHASNFSVKTTVSSDRDKTADSPLTQKQQHWENDTKSEGEKSHTPDRQARAPKMAEPVAEKKVSEGGKKRENRIKRIWNRFVSRYHGAVEKLVCLKRRYGEKKARLAHRLKQLAEKKDGVMSILYDKRNKPSFQKVKKVVFRVLRHMRPTKISGEIRFGFEDPAVTGYTLGLLSLLYPVYENRLMLYPDFENKRLQADVKAAGRLRASVFLFAACRLVFDKEIRRIIASFKNI